MSDDGVLLQVENLQTHFYSREGTLHAVDGVNFELEQGQTLGIAGESGCGKSVTAQSILRIVPENGDIVDGRILFHQKGKSVVDLVKLNPKSEQMRNIRGGEISMIFQEPMTSFSPVHTIGNQVMEVITLHQKTTKEEARNKALEILKRVGMPKPDQTIDSYTFNLSGGMRQRAMIAMALSCQPSLLIADEPTTAVDVTIQAVILKLIKQLQRDLHMALIMITHDLAVIAEIADRVLIMYLGEGVENGSVRDIFHNPKHPYTQGLLNSIPKFHGSKERIEPIRGFVPSPYEMPSGCPFHPRCEHFMEDTCAKNKPSQYAVGEKHFAQCFLYSKESTTQQEQPG